MRINFPSELKNADVTPIFFKKKSGTLLKTIVQ